MSETFALTGEEKPRRRSAWKDVEGYEEWAKNRRKFASLSFFKRVQRLRELYNNAVVDHGVVSGEAYSILPQLLDCADFIARTQRGRS